MGHPPNELSSRPGVAWHALPEPRPWAITIVGCVPCSAAPLGFPREEAAAPVGLCAAVLAAGVFVGHPDGRRGPSGCLPPLAGRSHFRPRAQSQCTRPHHPALRSPLRHKPATNCSLALPQRMGHRRLRAGRFHFAEGDLRLLRNVPGELCRLRHDHRPARRSVRRHSAALRLLFPAACHRHHCFHPDQRYRAGAICHVVGAGGAFCSSSSP